MKKKAGKRSSSEIALSRLRTRVRKQAAEISQLRYERLQLALLASEKPMFFNPFDVWNAKTLCRNVLKEQRRAA